MSWITVTATAILFVVGVTCTPIDVPQPAMDLLPPKVDSIPNLATDLMPPPVSAEIPENNWAANGDGEKKNNEIKQIIADTAEAKVQKASEEPELVLVGKLLNNRRKRHLHKKHSSGGGCGGGCGGGGGYYQPQPVYQPVCNTCGGGGGGYGGHGGGGSYSQASAQASSYGR